MAASPKKRTPVERRARRQRLARRAGLVALALALAAAWTWQRTLPLERIAVVGAAHAPADEVAALTGVAPDSVALFSLSPALMADRAQRHPWVETASVRRVPNGTLRIAVRERRPVVLVLDGDGRPSHFLDAHGYAMPATGATPALYDVPVMHDAPPYHAVQPVESEGLRSLLAALATAEPATLALVSEIDWGHQVTVWTTPAGGHGSIRVRLGHRDQARQLRALRAFWDQSVLPRPETPFNLVDVRFDGQVVTREGEPPAADSTARPLPASARSTGGDAPPVAQTAT